MNRDYAVQISDRRLSSGGSPIDDESNKAAVLTCADARLIVGFTGLAQVGNAFRTKQWLLDALLESAPPEFTALELTGRFVDRASKDFQELPVLRGLPAAQKKLTVMFTGFTAQETGARQVALLVSNFQDFARGRDNPEPGPEFQSTYFSGRLEVEDATWVQRVGMWTEFQDRDVAPLRKLLEDGRPPRAVIDKTIETMRAIADRPSVTTIGGQLSAILVPADFSVPPSSEYHSAKNVLAVQSPSLVVATDVENSFAIMDPEFRAVSPGAPALAVRKVSRNAPCPCRSGRKYKHCHGRFGPGAGGLNVVSTP
jgi:hypothetical protein